MVAEARRTLASSAVKAHRLLAEQPVPQASNRKQLQEQQISNRRLAADSFPLIK